MKRDTLGERLKEARIRKKMTQKEVVGNYITRNMLSQIESGAATPSIQTLEYLASVLDLSMGYLLDSDVTGQPSGQPETAAGLFAAGDHSGVVSLLEEKKELTFEERIYLIISYQRLSELEAEPRKAAEYARRSLSLNRGEYSLDGFLLRSYERLVITGETDIAADYRSLISKYDAAPAFLVSEGFYQMEREEYSKLAETAKRLREKAPKGIFAACLLLFEGRLREKEAPNSAAADYRSALSIFLKEKAAPFYLEKVYTMLEYSAIRANDYKEAHRYSGEKLRVLEAYK